MGAECRLGASSSYRDKIFERWDIAVLSGSSKQYEIPPDLVAQCVKLDLAKQYHVPCGACIKSRLLSCLWLWMGFSLLKKAQEYKESQG